MMILSHLATMCKDPGFIEMGLEYDEKVLAAPFKSLKEAELAANGRLNLETSSLGKKLLQ